MSRAVCSVDDIPPGEGRIVMVGTARVALFRAGDGWRATDAVCPHRGGPLADGIVADNSVTCPLHLRRFSLDTGEAIDHDCPALTVHEVLADDGQVYVTLAS